DRRLCTPGTRHRESSGIGGAHRTAPRPGVVMTVTAPAPVSATAVRTGTTAGVRRTGMFVTAGALTWTAAMLTVGNNPADSLGITISDLAALPFQASLFALVTTQLRTRA